MNDKERITALKKALAHYTVNRYVVLDRMGRPLDTNYVEDGDTVLLDRVSFESDDPSEAIIAAMAENLAYVRYVQACDNENLEPHTLHMWEVHGRPNHPLGHVEETLLQERSYEVENGGI